MDNDQDYISQMVEDTFQEVESSESNILEFSNNQTEIVMKQLAFDFDSINGVLDRQRGCICMHHNGQNIEIPNNWGVFRYYDFSHESFAINIEKHEDVDQFLEVISLVMGEEVESLFIIVDGNDVQFKLNQTQISSLVA